MERWSKELGETHTRTNERKFRCRSTDLSEAWVVVLALHPHRGVYVTAQEMQANI